ncbi:MAG: hypothetical protein QGI83_20380, partial [Candidatus Latescibacteria bacterium]|nr:hypothetical protein [Candidatus Latescibacterota bacterium]
MEPFVFLNEEQVREVRSRFGTPVFVYDQATLEARAREVLGFPNAYGLTARYAMKALPTAAVIRILTNAGLHIDASSGFEAERAMRAGVPPDHIQLTAQELPANLGELVGRGVLMNACSVEQLRVFGETCPGRSATVRVNPGLGSGHSNRTNVGGPSASFGIWHEHLGRAMSVARDCGLKITGMHTHIGSGSDPEVWERCALMSLGIAAGLPDATVLSLGGGYKVGRMPGEPSTDLSVIGAHIAEAFQAFAGDHGRKLRLEVEPGTYLVANAGALVCTAIDVVDTGTDGYRFIKVDAGMTEVLRPSLYGAQHPIASVPAEGAARDPLDYLVVGQGSLIGTAEAVTDYMREKHGVKVGVVNMTMFRPFPGDLIGNLLKGRKGVVVLERTDQPLAGDLPLIREIRATLTKCLENAHGNGKTLAYPDLAVYKQATDLPPLYSGCFGLGSRDLQPEGVVGAIENMLPDGGRRKLFYLSIDFIRDESSTPKADIYQEELKESYPNVKQLAVKGSENPNLLPNGAITVRMHSVGGWGAMTTGKNLAITLYELL